MVEWNIALVAEIDSEPDCDRLLRFRVRLRRRAYRPVFSLRVARGASQHGYKGCREAGDRVDRDDGRAGPQPADRFGKERLRHAQKPATASLRRYYAARPRVGALRLRDQGGAGYAPAIGGRRNRAVLARERWPARDTRSESVLCRSPVRRYPATLAAE